MDMKLELVPIPVTDVDRAKAFYTDQLGFVADVDVPPGPGVRVVQLTPPGSACSIGLGTGLAAYEAAPGSVRALHLVVDGHREGPRGAGRPRRRGRRGRRTSAAACGTRGSATRTATPGRCRRWPGAPGRLLGRAGEMVSPPAARCAARPAARRRPTSATKSPSGRPEPVVVVEVHRHGDRRLQQLDQVGALPGVHRHGQPERLRAAEVRDERRRAARTAPAPRRGTGRKSVSPLM